MCSSNEVWVRKDSLDCLPISSDLASTVWAATSSAWVYANWVMRVRKALDRATMVALQTAVASARALIALVVVVACSSMLFAYP